MAWNATLPTDNGLLINAPGQIRANWDAIALSTDSNLLITNAKVAANAAIVDTKLAQISTAGKVSGAALTLLPNIPSGAGNIPTANLGNALLPNTNIDIGDYELRAQTLQADVLTGTKPLTVNSTTKVDNLNADKLDDQDGSYYTTIANQTGILPIAKGGTGVALVQRGRTSCSNGTVVTYPTSFGDTNYTLIITPDGQNTGIVWSYHTKTATGFTFYTNGAGPYVVDWLAIDDL